MHNIAWQTRQAFYHFCSRKACAPITEMRLKITTKGIRWTYTARYGSEFRTEKGIVTIPEAHKLTIEHFTRIGKVSWIKYYSGVKA